MEYRQLGSSPLRVSAIAFGCMSLGDDHAENEHMLHRAFALGINFFDTADLYQKGRNEESVGRALKDRRDRVIIATKAGNQWRADGSGWDWNPRKDYILSAAEASLRRLGTDYIDLYQLHGGTIEDPIDETIEAFELLKAQGKILQYGISSIRPNVIREYVRRSSMVSNMMQYSLLDRRPEEAALDLLYGHGIGVIIRGAVAQGMFSGKRAAPYLDHSAEEVAQAQALLNALSGSVRTPVQTALRYCLAQPAVSTIVAGASRMAQLEENAAAMDTPALTQAELESLRAQVRVNRYEQHR